MSCVFLFSNKVSLIEHYHNSSYLEYGGSPDKAIRSAFVTAFDRYLRQNNKYNKDESRVTFGDIQDSLVFISSNFSTQTSYENQTKKAINNKFIQDAMNEFLKEQLHIYFIENPLIAEKVTEQVLVNKRSRETAEKTRLNIKRKLSGGIDITNRVAKFVDCRTREIDRRELYIVEGDSALGSVKMGRDAEFQAIMPVRGKILNCLKADLPRIFKSDIITDLIKVLGCGVEVSHKKSKDLSNFDLSALRWSKIIICTDADVDGFQIRTLILAMLYRLTPTLIREGYVYIAESPLYEIVSKGKSHFAYNDSERDEIIKKLGDAKYVVHRSKGLGENEADMMWLTTMNPETRRLIKVVPEDSEKTSHWFDLLLGDNLAGRKDFIAEEGHRFVDFADVS
jgi:DNA gyrase subunit B